MHDGQVRESKLLWTLGNYSRFVRPGMVRIQCEVTPQQSYVDGVLGSAYRDDSHAIVLVLANLSTEEKSCALNLPGVVEVYTTSAETNLRQSRQDSADIRIPARAVVTVRAVLP